MNNKLQTIAERFEEVAEQLTQPEAVNDTEKYTALMKEYSRLQPIAEKYKAYRRAEAENAEAQRHRNVDERIQHVDGDENQQYDGRHQHRDGKTHPQQFARIDELPCTECTLSTPPRRAGAPSLSI